MHWSYLKIYIIIKCECRGKYKLSKDPIDVGQICKRSTYKVWCLLQSNRCLRKSDEFWHIIIIKVKHNHEPSSNITCHLRVRHLKFDQSEARHQIVVIGITPKDIFFILRQSNSSTQVIAKTIYNKKLCIWKVEFGSDSSIFVLVNQLWKENFCFDYGINENDQVTNLFFAHLDYVNLVLLYISYGPHL